MIGSNSAILVVAFRVIISKSRACDRYALSIQHANLINCQEAFYGHLVHYPLTSIRFASVLLLQASARLGRRFNVPNHRPIEISVLNRERVSVVREFSHS
jgi:hypothetical protein